MSKIILSQHDRSDNTKPDDLHLDANQRDAWEEHAESAPEVLAPPNGVPSKPVFRLPLASAPTFVVRPERTR
jgi:hypothetical protein